MPKLRSIVLSFFVLTAVTYNSLVLWVFESNRDFFATEKCVERAVEANSCQGACQLRALLQDDKPVDEPKAPVFTEEIELWLNLPNQITQLSAQVLLLKQRFTWETYLIQDGIKGSIWRPPQCGA